MLSNIFTRRNLKVAAAAASGYFFGSVLSTFGFPLAVARSYGLALGCFAYALIPETPVSHRIEA